MCLRRQTDTPPAFHFVIVVCTRNSIIHVIQQLERRTCHHSTTAAGSRLSVQRPDPTDRWLKFQSSYVTLLFALPLHCGRLRRQTETPSALHFVIVCASNSIIHVQRSQLGTCCHITTAAPGSRLTLQRLDPTDRWLKFQSSFVTLLFTLPLHCVRLLRRQTETPPALHFIVCTSNSMIHVQRSQLGTCYKCTPAGSMPPQPPLRIPPMAETPIFPPAPLLTSTKYHLSFNTTQPQHHYTSSLSTVCKNQKDYFVSG